MHALFPEFRKVGFHLSLSDPVPDKFQVKDAQGSFRGLSRGVAVASKFPLFSPRPSFVPEVIWASQRLLYSVVQVGQLPIHFLTLYLYPNAPISGERYILNCKLVHWAVQIAESINGLVLLAGDFNTKWQKFDELQELSNKGWQDTHERAATNFGTPLEPTCKQATRHTFLLSNPGMYPFLKHAKVSFPHDLDSHAVLQVGFDLPTYNPKVYKWLLPRTLDHCAFDKEGLEAYVVPEDQKTSFLDGFAENNPAASFRAWSQLAEDALLAKASTPTGEAVPKAKHVGRGSLTAPVLRDLAAPRFKYGRGSDFTVPLPSTKVQVRQVQKQARRLQSLLRLLRKPNGYPANEVRQLWEAVLSSSGFGRSFTKWVLSYGTIAGLSLSLEVVEALYDMVTAFATALATQAWKARHSDFVLALEDSWKSNGGSLPFRLIKERPLPPVLDLTICHYAKLLPQRWSQYGLEWIKISNPSDFPIGSEVNVGQRSVKVVAVAQDSIQLTDRLTRREASNLHRVFTTADPHVWAPQFLKKWEHFWCSESLVDPQEDKVHQVLRHLPSFPQESLPPLCWDDWVQAVHSAKKHIMRGVDGWSAKELCLLPRDVVELLFKLFDQINEWGAWPVQLTTWLLVLLRKTDSPSPDWSLLRPISVAGLVYRIWSRMQTKRLMVRARLLSTTLVSPALSTKAIWVFLGDLISKRSSEGRPLCGFVLDIIKCFNVLDRGLLKALFGRFGFDAAVTDLWMLALGDMQRMVLVGGYVYGSSQSNSGIPEGDPLSVVGMFVFAYSFYKYLESRVPTAMVATYADNWEILADGPSVLKNALQETELFLDAFHLPVAVPKCWSWAIRACDRKRQRAFQLYQESLPVKLSARELGADISYCFKLAAKVRNVRVKSGHLRLLKLAGLPVPIWRKTRLLLSSVFPHSLHAAETSWMPKSTLQRLRTKVTKGLGLAAKGSSPYLSCLLGTYQCVDPEYVIAVNRLRTFRQVVRELPELHAFFMDQLQPERRYKGPSALLVKSLNSLGWSATHPGLFQDEYGRLFHLCLTPLAHISKLLLSSWCDVVSSRVNHRLYLTDLTNIDLQLTKQVRHLLPGERALLRGQQTGAFFSGEYAKHFVQVHSIPCRFCGAVDSRVHRLCECPKVQPWKALFPRLMQEWDALPLHTSVFGLWEEPRTLRAWQGHLDSTALPCVPRQRVDTPQVLYSDGACLNPGLGYLRLAAAAVVLAEPAGTFQVAWRGQLPMACQTPFRAELLAGSVALRLSTQVWLFSDCKAFVTVAKRILQSKRTGQPLCLPRENADLWAYFAESLDGLDADKSDVFWVKGHVSYQTCSGPSRIHAWFNHWADRTAHATVMQVAKHPLFQDLCTEFRKKVSLARDLASYQAGVGMIFASEKDAPSALPPVVLSSLTPIGQVSQICTSGCLPPVPVPAFCAQLLDWFRGLSISDAVRASPLGDLEDMAWVELFWGFVHCTGTVPPFRYNGDWVCVGDDPCLVFVLPSFLELFRSWKLHLDALLRAGVLLLPGERRSRVTSLSALGGRFAGAGFSGRVSLPLTCLQEFALQLCAVPRVSALRLPASAN